MAAISTLTDTFSGTLDTTTKWAFSYGTPTNVGGKCELSVISTYEGIYSGVTYDWTNSSAYCKVVVPVIGNGTKVVGLRAEQASGVSNSLSMVWFNGNLQMKRTIGGVEDTGSITYSSTDHAYWRIRTSGTDAFWDTSPDGVVWTNRRSLALSTLAVTAMYAHVFAGYDGTESASTATVDNFNAGVSFGSAPDAAATAVANQPAAAVKAKTSVVSVVGMYTGYGDFGGISGQAANESLTGRRMEMATDYLPHDTWSRFNASVMRSEQLDPWRIWRDSRPGSKFVYGLPLLTSSNVGDFSGVVAGTYDSYFTIAGNALVASGHRDAIVMLGWEPNNAGIGAWQATSNPSGYISAFQHVVTLLRGITGNAFKFSLSSAIGPAGSISAFLDYYPGDSYVDYIGMNIYDVKWMDATVTNAQRWNYIRTTGMGVDAHATFAASRGKPLVCHEWGLYASGDNYAGGGDNPYFIQEMFAYFQRENVAFQSYFDFDWGGGSLADFPNGEAKYADLFSPAGMDQVFVGAVAYGAGISFSFHGSSAGQAAVAAASYGAVSGIRARPGLVG
ncbi:hypothetical protein ACFWPU_01045 [Streptomyces sp. NPDC058471]|uniref:hypothetical protein n=1 Tax=Streptomyces sp. NPDC058471 TaxID=3346516 RepID=UPI00364ACD3E